MPNLKLYLFGPPRVELDGAPVDLKRRRVLALLIYLAMSRQPHSRDALAAMFWPDYDQSRARAYLRRDLAALNTGLASEWLLTDRDIIELKSDFWLDVVQFRQYLADCQPHGQAPQPLAPDCLTALTKAAALYTADFLEGFTLRDSPAFDEWQFFETEGLRQELAAALARLVLGYNDRGEFETAIPYARRWVTLDPLHEPAQHRLIQLYDQAGQVAAAMRQYEEYVQLLEQELGLPPEEETTTLYEAIKAKRILASHFKPEPRIDDIVPRPPPQNMAADGPDHPRQAAPALARLEPRQNLPAQSSLFIGRAEELAEIKQLLVEEPACRLVTLLGPGGTGKTRLALAAATAVANHFSDGVYFAPLAAVSEPQFIVPAIIEALNLTLHGSKEPKTQLLHYLRNKELLLVVDNFEHLLASLPKKSGDGPALLAEMLTAAPAVKLLITSQERLNLAEEWSYEVQGLKFPAPAEPYPDHSEAIGRYSAIRLFVEAARRVEASFTLLAGDIPAVVQICRLVDGLPLGLELAASWVRSMSCQEIAQEIERSFDFLTTAKLPMPERHRSLRAVFEQTWQRLPEAEQRVLSGLSLFRGGCAREAAEAVTGATLPQLASLVEKALLHRTESHRFELHQLICQFALEQLQANPALYEQIQLQHSAYYTSFLHRQTENLKCSRQKEALAEITDDIDNIRVAWRQAVERQDVVALEKAVTCMWLFSELRSAFHEGEAAFQQAATSLTAADTPATGRAALTGFLLAGQGYLGAQRGKLREGRILMEQGLAWLQQAEPADRFKEAFARMWLAWVLLTQGKYAAAKLVGQESLAFFTEVEDRWGVAACFQLLGAVAYRRGRLAEAEQMLTGCLIICQEIEARGFGYWARLNLALVLTTLGAYAQAKQLLEEAHRISQELNHPLGLAYAQRELGNLAISRGDYSQAIQIIQQSVAMLEEIGSSWYLGSTLIYLGSAHRLQGNFEEAERLSLQSLEAARMVDHSRYVALSLSHLGCLAYDRGEYSLAEQYQQEALAVWRELDHPVEIASVLRHLGQVTTELSDDRVVEASQYFKEALQLALEHRLAPIALDVMVGLARFQRQPEQAERAVELAALAEHHPASTHQTRQLARQQLAALAQLLSAETFAAAQSRGQALDWQTSAAQLVTAAGSLSARSQPRQSPQPAAQPGSLADWQRRFKQQTLIASGGMGEVYRGQDLETGQPVAIKRVKPNQLLDNSAAVQRLIYEGELLRQLNHPNIVKVLATIETGEEAIIVMEYVPGGSLRELLNEEPQLPLARAVNIGLELADALARAHHLNVIHRDIKPENVLLADDGTPRLTDFGLACLVQPGAGLRQDGVTLGTTVYLSPEAWRGEELDTRSDIWSFGVLLYEMLAGRPPFVGQHVVALLTAVLNDPQPDLSHFRPDAPPPLIDLLKQMLVKEREQRIDSMRQVAAGMERVRRRLSPFR